jgi:PilZ domain-containing protein
MSDKRTAVRQKTLLRGFVYFGGSPTAAECVVRDISETGARLKFQNPPTAADTLDLHIPVKGQTIRATLKWAKGDEVGIAFLAIPTLAGPQAMNDELSDRVNRLEMEIASLKQLIRSLQKTSASKSEAA